uniref:PSP proline-rich domain-containing protein n=1 Tax=Plectus sambesii TaxID=2011161 RepID=A0A914WSS6_9BILA
MTTETEVDEGVGSGDEGNYENVSKKELQEIERKRQKNKKRKEQKKRRAKEKQTSDVGNSKEGDEAQVNGTSSHAAEESAADSGTGDTPAATDDEDVEVEFIGQMPKIELQDPNYHYFTKIFQTFKIGGGEDDTLKVLGLPQVKKEEAPTKAAIVERILQEEMEEKREREREEGGDIKKLSKKKLRLQMRPSIAILKASTLRPDVVEWHDVTSKDPHLLVQLKAYRNSVPVPRHWCAKRKYLAGKRGFERAPFELPENIKRTGIMEMREALAEKEDSQSLKSKMRERMRPKLGRIDIDYQKLHDAFFKWQTKPPLTKTGDLYFEGKELETQMREKKPGELSDDLRIALGMPVGPNAHKFPPPWLIAMQRYGPPPSYPNLKIAGLNAPIPESCAFGYHAGGWGKPPVDEYGKPLYGDVFGLEVPTQPQLDDEAAIERRHWGEMDSDEEVEESSDEEEEDDQANDQAVDASGMATPMQEGMITPSGISSGIPTGVETPDTIELRKRKQVEEGSEAPGPLYTILPEKKIDRVGGQMMASTHVYEMAKKDRNVTEGGVEVSLNPEELDMQDQKGLERKYEEQLRKQAKGKEEDFSDMVAEHSAKQNRKRKAQDQKKAPTTKKNYKDFKF